MVVNQKVLEGDEFVEVMFRLVEEARHSKLNYLCVVKAEVLLPIAAEPLRTVTTEERGEGWVNNIGIL